jgi:hypothetical protein
MCDFFSAISDGRGKVLFFTLEQIKKLEKEGNKETYDWNSHTSIAHYNEVDEDAWNKWWYDCESKILKIDNLVTINDSSQVKNDVEKYLAKNGTIYCQKIYNRNSGDWNSGAGNSGNWNSGDWNSGNRNSGNWNSGDWNSGNRNSGNRNSGAGNSGDWNSGNWNSGNRNSGDWNSGNWNSGDWNSGNWNSGNWNSGNWNSGNWNSGFLNTITPPLMMFNKPAEIELKNINFPKYFTLQMTKWIDLNSMTDAEKAEHPTRKTTDGCLKKYTYHDAWMKSFSLATKEDVALTLLLPNFDYAIFEEISGISKEMLDGKLK